MVATDLANERVRVQWISLNEVRIEPELVNGWKFQGVG